MQHKFGSDKRSDLMPHFTILNVCFELAFSAILRS